MWRKLSSWNSIKQIGRGGKVDWLLYLAILLLSGLWLYWGIRRYHPFFSDDGFISLRYSARLLEGKGLTWTDGEHVEGYSNLAWVLGCAIFGLFRSDLIECARALGVVSTFAAICALIYQLRPRRLALAELLPVLSACFVFCNFGGTQVWSIAGLEAPLLTCFLAWALVLAFPLLDPQVLTGPRRPYLVGVFLGLAAWTRPEGPLWVGLLCLSILATSPLSKSKWLIVSKIAAVALAFTLAQLIFRRFYYHEWLANSALAKLAWGPERLETGKRYLREFWGSSSAMAWFCGLGVLACVFAPEVRRRVLTLLFVAAVWLVYLLFVGGDIFCAYRQLVPVALFAALVTGEGMAWCCKTYAHARYVALLLAVHLGYEFQAAQELDENNILAIRERWEWDGQPVGALLKRHYGATQPSVAVDAAGSLPYFTGFPAFDMLGLNDRYLAHHPPPDFGKGLMGHDLGDGKYMLSRAPDLIFFHLPAGDEFPMFRSGREAFNDASFARDYEFVALDAPPVVARFWARRGSPRLVPQTADANARVVPPLFLSNHARAPLRENAQGNLVAIATSAAPAGATLFDLTPGNWQVSAELERGSARLRIYIGTQQISGENRAVFSINDTTQPVSIRVEPLLEPEVAVLRVLLRKT